MKYINKFDVNTFNWIEVFKPFKTILSLNRMSQSLLIECHNQNININSLKTYSAFHQNILMTHFLNLSIQYYSNANFLSSSIKKNTLKLLLFKNQS